MSEYQYYEFLAVDRLLTERQIEQVRNISTRAELTSTRFVNEYHWGDFKGDPVEFVTKYYDLMIYVANWGTHRLLIGLPGDAVGVKRRKRYESVAESGLEVRVRGERVVLDLNSQKEDFDYEDSDSADRWMSAVAPVREDLLAGDLRPLFPSWLSSLWIDDDEEDEETESEDADTPPIPPGLAELTDAQEELAAFLRVDEDLLAAAAKASPPLQPATKELKAWLSELPPSEKDRLLLEAASGREPHLGSKLSRRFRAETTPADSDGAVLPLRQLFDRARAFRGERKARAREAAERARRQREAKAAAVREAHLKQLMRDEENTWSQVEEILRLKQNRSYGDAVATLKDLREVAVRKSALDAFASRVRQLRESHKAKYTFVEKLDKAKLV